MLTLAEFDDAWIPIRELYTRYENSIIEDIARRLSNMESIVSSTTAWQTQKLIESGAIYEEVLSKISRLTGKSTAELKKSFHQAGVRSTYRDDNLYKRAGLTPPPLKASPNMLRALEEGFKKTDGLMKNLTLTTASSAQTKFIESADLAYQQVLTGTMDYSSAIKSAIKNVGRSGLPVLYPSGHVDKLDVAMRRAVLTGVAQTTNQMQITRAEEMGIDLVEVSAHIGARPSHEIWQGRVYSRSGTSDKYPPFIESTGYGTGDGLGGWNCRHSFAPFFEGLSERNYSDRDLQAIKSERVDYNGEQLTLYDANQIQRGMERQVRRWKREADLMGLIKKDNAFEIGKVQYWQSQLRDFIKQTGLRRQYDRESILRTVKKVSPPSSPLLREQILGPGEGEPLTAGMFGAKKVKLEGGGEGVLKPDIPPKAFEGIKEGFARREVLSYEIDNLLGLDIVPETSAYIDETGYFSLQKWVKNAETGFRGIGDEYFTLTNRYDPGHMSLLDMITGNQDRFTGGNWVIANGRIRAIDNGLGFLTTEKGQGSLFGFMRNEASRAFQGFKSAVSPDKRFYMPLSTKNRLREMLDSGELKDLLSNPEYKLDQAVIDSTIARAENILKKWDDLFVTIDDIPDLIASKGEVVIPAGTRGDKIREAIRMRKSGATYEEIDRKVFGKPRGNNGTTSWRYVKKYENAVNLEPPPPPTKIPLPKGTRGEQILEAIRMRKSGATYEEIDRVVFGKPPGNNGTTSWRYIKKYMVEEFDTIDTMLGPVKVAKKPKPAFLSTDDAIESLASGTSAKRTRDAMKLVDEVHGFREDVLEIPGRQVRFQMSKKSLGKNVNGDYSGGFNPRIRVRTGNYNTVDREMATAIHELGHYIDNHHLNPGEPGVFPKWGTLENIFSRKNNPIKEWWKIVNETDTYKTLIAQATGLVSKIEAVTPGGTTYRTAVSQKFAQYLGDAKELWARAYVQYIAEKTQNELLLKTVYRSSSRSHYYYYWTKEEFKPILKAMDQIFDSLGVLK